MSAKRMITQSDLKALEVMLKLDGLAIHPYPHVSYPYTTYWYEAYSLLFSCKENPTAFPTLELCKGDLIVMVNAGQFNAGQFIVICEKHRITKPWVEYDFKFSQQDEGDCRKT